MTKRTVHITLALGAGLAIAMGGCVTWRHLGGPALLEFRIRQDPDLILFSDFGEPPQFALWLEDLETGRLRTLFVTRRAGTGQWEGKAECPAALPGWYAVYRRETGRTGLPTPEHPAPDGVTGATPKSADFRWQAEVEPGSRWICWIEVNLAADFNEAFPQYNEVTGAMDTDFTGQPSLLYRGEIVAKPGARVVPELYGYVPPGNADMAVEKNVTTITTARDIFKTIEIRVVRPGNSLFGAGERPMHCRRTISGGRIRWACLSKEARKRWLFHHAVLCPDSLCWPVSWRRRDSPGPTNTRVCRTASSSTRGTSTNAGRSVRFG